MKAKEVWHQVYTEFMDHPHADVVVVDEDGFVHVVDELFWDHEQNRWTVRTRWQTSDEVTQDGPGYPVQ